MRALVDQCLRRRLLIVASLAIAMMRFAGAPVVAGAQSQTGTVVGRVTDARSGNALPGASVQVDGTRLGAITGEDGRYRILNVPSGARTLIVLRLGYAANRQSVTIAAGATLNHEVGLQATAVSLDQVVVTGTAGETERRSIGNAVSTIDATTEMDKGSPPDLANLLRARTTGVDIQPISGRIGAGPTIQIRGPSSIGLSNNPLIYIDGVRVNNSTNLGPTAAGSGALGSQGNPVESRLNDINPEDIESIEIIKGPAAATIYGTEAANGVIQIITKKGASGGAQVRSEIIEGPMYFRDAADRVPTNYDKDKSGNIVPWNGVQAMADSGTPLFKTGLERHYSSAVVGGVDQLRYYASLGYENDYGIEPNNLQRDFNAHVNLSTPIGTSTDVSTSLNYIDMSTHLGADVGASALLGAMAGHSLLFPAAFGFYPNYPPAVPQTLYDNATGINRFTGSTTINNQLTHWFTQRGILGIDYTDEDDRAIEHFAPPALQAFLSPANAGGRLGQTLRRTTMFTADYSGTAKASLASTLVSSTSVGGQFNNAEADVSSIGGLGFPASGVETVSAAAQQVAATQTQIINTTVGGYVQEEFAWRDRLFLTGAVRVDNNSAFGQDFKWVTYPKASVSYVVSDEPFWKWGNSINTLRLRAAYGASGRQPQAFSALQTFSPVVGPGGTNAVTPGTLGNADLRPERGAETELGFEAGVFNRLSLDFTYYNKTTQNEIVNQSVAPSTGFSGSQLINLGKVENNGIELGAKFQAVARRNFSWDITGNLSTIHDVIKSNVTNSIASVGQYNIVGYPIGGLWSKRVVSAGRDPVTNLAINVLCDGGSASELPPGVAGGPPVACASAPFVYIGDPTPHQTFSLGNTFMIGKSLRLYALVDGRRGNRIWNQNDEIRCDGLAGAPLCRANYYPLEYSPTYLAAASLNAAVGNYLDQFIQDASFVKLRELSATYYIPSRFLPRVSNPSITFAARELHTWTKYDGIDPEAVAQNASSSTSPGGPTAIDQGVIPPLTRFLVTFNFSW